MRRATVAERLNRRLDKSGECWEWTGGSRHKFGYGMIVVAGRVRTAHAVSWELANGTAVPPGQVVRHTCDNPPCCRPEHLVTGTHGDNMRDMASRGRAGQARLDPETVREARRLYGTGFTQREIADQVGIHQTAVSMLLAGKTYRQVAA